MLNFVTLGFASAVALFCLVITIFYAFDVASVRISVKIGAVAVATAGALIVRNSHRLSYDLSMLEY